jgi:hypothetical protein
MNQQRATFFVDRIHKILLKILCGMTLCLAAFSVMGMSTAPIAIASTGPSIGLQPAYFDPQNPITRSYFIFNTTPGAHFKSAIRVSNTGLVAGRATLYSTDATTGATSGTVYLGQNNKPKDVGAWINLSASSFTLASGQSRIVSFNVAPPKNVRPGQHVGGIAMEVTPINATTSPVQKNGQMQIRTRIITVIAVELIFPGAAIQSLSAAGVQGGGVNNNQILSLKLQNNGTMMIKPYGTLELFNARGSRLQTLLVSMDTFLPNTSINYPIYLKQVLGAGKYQALLVLKYGNNHTLRYSTSFPITSQQIQQVFSTSRTIQSSQVGARPVNSSLPWWMLLVGGFFVLCGLFFLIQQSRRVVLSVRGKKQETQRRDSN